MEKKIDKEKRKKIVIGVGAALLLLLIIIILFFLLHKKTYTVTFESNGGSKVASVTVEDGDKVKQPEDPTKEGYIFAGWYYLDEIYDFEWPVKKDILLEAKWKKDGNAEIEGITLNITDFTLAVDETKILVATLLPEDAKQVKLIWSSSDETIAVVDENGRVKALKEGNVTITVTTEDGKYSASCTVTVSSKVVEEVPSEENNNNENNNDNNSSNNNNGGTSKPSTIEPSNVSIDGAKDMTVGDSVKLTATISPSNANSRTKLTWSSSNSNVVTVDANGNITAVGAGSATITVTTANGKKASVTINVANKTVEVDSIQISGADSVTEGSSINLAATVSPSDATDKSIVWSSSNTSIATVDQNGKVTGVSAGTVTITAKASNGKTATYKVTVKAKDVPQPPKEDKYSITFTRVKQEGTGTVMQYKYTVYKNGSAFSDYLGFDCGGYKVKKGTSYASLKTEAKSASLTLGDGTVVTASVNYKD